MSGRMEWIIMIAQTIQRPSCRGLRVSDLLKLEHAKCSVVFQIVGMKAARCPFYLFSINCFGLCPVMRLKTVAKYWLDENPSA